MGVRLLWIGSMVLLLLRRGIKRRRFSLHDLASDFVERCFFSGCHGIYFILILRDGTSTYTTTQNDESETGHLQDVLIG
jgi:hypothetical protein